MKALNWSRNLILSFLDFDGRIARKGYWAAFATALGLAVFFQVLLLAIFNAISARNSGYLISYLPFLSLMAAPIFSFATLSFCARRFQDVGWSGHWFKWMFRVNSFALALIAVCLIAFPILATWFVLACIPPLASVLVTFWIGFKKSQPGTNAFGPNPNEVPS